MKKIKFLTINILIILIIFTIFPISNVFASDSEPSINATSAILIDNRTNKVLYGKNENEKMYPASTTKIMTAILSLENTNLDDKVVASYDAVMNVPDGYSIANIQVGEELTIEQLLEVLLVHSANDAANVLAENIGGSVDSFVSMMNTKCNELGLLGTHFTNAYGLHDENHYTTASDLAKLMQYSLKNEDFRRLAGLASCTLPQTNMSAPRSYSSTNEMIIPGNEYYYQYITAGKTGFTTPAGECLVSSGYKDNLELICVVLGCFDSSSRFNDVKNLYESIETSFQKGIAKAKTIYRNPEELYETFKENSIHKIELNNLPRKRLDGIVKKFDEELLKPLSTALTENQFLQGNSYQMSIFDLQDVEDKTVNLPCSSMDSEISKFMEKRKKDFKQMARIMNCYSKAEEIRIL